MADLIDDKEKQPSATPINGSQTSFTKPQNQSGSGFTNLQRVMGANQGNQLGSTVAGGINNQSGQVKTNLNQATSNFNTASQAGRLDTDANKQAAQADIDAANQGNVSDQQVQDFSRYKAGAYSGPQSLDNTDALQGQAQNAESLGQATGTSGGRNTLLQRFAGGNQGGYTAGKQRLDSLLLGQDQNQLQNARRGTLGLTNQVNTQSNVAGQLAGQYANQAQDFGTALKNQVGSNVDTSLTGLDTEVQHAEADRQAKVAALQGAFTGSNPYSQADATNLGLTSGEHLFNINPGQYLTENSLQANRGNVASAADYAKISALGKLGGTDLSQNAQLALNDFNDPTQAGTFQSSTPYTFDKDAFNKELSKQSWDYGQAAAPTNQNLKNIANDITSAQDELAKAKANPVGYDTAHSPYTLYGTNSGAAAKSNVDYAQSVLDAQLAEQAKQQQALSQIQSQYGFNNLANIMS